MKKINSLTKEQESQLAAYRDKWLQIGLSCEPADRTAAVAGVNKAYAAAGMAPPKFVIWLDGPLAGAYGAAMLANMPAQVGAQVRDQVRDQVGAQVGAQVRDQVGAQVRDQVGAQVGAQVRDQVWAQVWAQVRDQVGDQVGAQVRDQVWDQVGAQVGAQVRDQVWDQVWDQVRDQVGDQVWKAGYGSHDANWLGFYDFMQFAGIEDAARLNGLQEVAATSGWFWPFQNLVILTERHNVLKRDAENRLHCEDGPAIEYKDGMKLWRWHGVKVPEAWLSGQKPSAKEALTWPNIEQRRAACEIVGWANILKELDAKVIDTDEAEVGTLLEVDLPDSGKERFLQVTCGTGRQFALPVPPEMKTALEASAWTYGLDGDISNYLPEVRT